VIDLKFWICVTTNENWSIIKDKNIWGVPERSRRIIENVKPGDKIAIYVIQTREKDKVVPSRIVGIYEVVSEAYFDNSPIFAQYRGKTFPYRIKIRPIKIFSKPLVFRDLIDKLSFIKNKRFWTVYFRRAMFEIPEKDFEVIESSGE